MVPARPLGRTRETPPTVRRRIELRSLAALDFKSSAVTCLPVSPQRGCSATLLDSRTPGERRSPEPELAPLARTPRPGFEPGNPLQDTSVAGRRPTRLDHRGKWVDEDSNLGLVPPRHESSAAGPSTRKWLCVYSSVGARTKATARCRPRRGVLRLSAQSRMPHRSMQVPDPSGPVAADSIVDRVCLPRWASDRFV